LQHDRFASGPAFKNSPINQIWRDHLLAGSVLLADSWKEGTYVALHPAGSVVGLGWRNLYHAR
jgi:hypothetical protein